MADSEPPTTNVENNVQTISAPRPLMGNFRYISERRQYGGLLMLTGFCAIIQPLANIATAVGPDGPQLSAEAGKGAGHSDTWRFVGACCLFAIGAVSMLVGYLETICDWGEITHTTLLIILTQTAFIPYVSDMAGVGHTMGEDPPRFFMVFPDDSGGLDRGGLTNRNMLMDNDEVYFIGSVGIFGILSYGFAFVGAISFMQFAIYAFRAGKPQDRNSDYFRGRLGFYSIMLFIGGLCQILLGSFATQFNLTDGGRIEGGILRVAMFVVHFPWLTIVVGCLQFLNGFWGFCRSCYVGVGARTDNIFQCSMALLWLVVLTCQDIVQVSYLPGGMLAPAAPTFAALSFGVLFMPAYLDYKMRNTPLNIDDEFYFGSNPVKSDEERPMIHTGTPGGIHNNERKLNARPPLQLRKIYVMERPAIIEQDWYDGVEQGQEQPLRKSKRSKRPASPVKEDLSPVQEEMEMSI